MTTTTPDPIAIIALIVSLLAAGFTGWEAVNTHLERRSKGRAKLQVIGTPLQGADEGDRWVVNNVGDGSASGIEVEILLHGIPETGLAISFLGDVLETLHGKSVAPIRPRGNPWPAALNYYRDFPEVRVWKGATARARWTDAHGRAHFKPVPVVLPEILSEPF